MHHEILVIYLFAHYFICKTPSPPLVKFLGRPIGQLHNKLKKNIEQLGDNFESAMTSYFEDFKKSMKQRLRIPISLVEKHYDDVCFLVDADHTYVQATIPRVRWLKPLPYEINVDEAFAAITTLLAKDIDKSATSFGNYEEAKSRITIDLKTAIVLRNKNKLVKKLKERFGEGGKEEEEDDEEEKQGQAPLELTQGLGEDLVEEAKGVKGEEAKEAPKDTKAKKRKAKEQTVEKLEKPLKKPQQKPAIPITRSSTRATTVQATKVVKPKDKRTLDTTELSEPAKKTYKKLKKKSVPQPDSDEEKSELDDLSQYKVVSHNPSFDIDNLCGNIVTNANLSRFTHVDFDNLGSVDKNKVEESIYEMMTTFKSTPLEIVDSLPKSLYDQVEKKWQFSLTIERQIREAQLAQVMPA